MAAWILKVKHNSFDIYYGYGFELLQIDENVDYKLLLTNADLLWYSDIFYSLIVLAIGTASFTLGALLRK